mmetsp:Transcript_8845/g.21615  ORF Transcript_8845/g.21615 Transcript_8845/m.21615 type:complete len:830 (-) Transcript_8845:180-2669(-)
MKFYSLSASTVLLMTFKRVSAFITSSKCSPSTECRPSMHDPNQLFMTSVSGSNLDPSEDDDAESVAPVVGRPVSRMTNYAAQFLDRTASQETPASDNDDIKLKPLEEIAEATHLVAIPLESSHELLIELESVQRAILHHCPILLDACIGGTTTRLPLLYIKAPDSNLNDNPQNSATVTTGLAGTVKRLVSKHFYGKVSKKLAGDDDNGVEGSDDNDALNAEGYRPLTMTFQSLEIDGNNNKILNTVGTFCSCDDDETDGKCEDDNENYVGKGPNYNEKRFENFICDLQSAIAAQGWEVAFPPDPNRNENDLVGTTIPFRPRVAFMELPKKFDENISRFKDKDTEIKEDMEFLKVEEGGNGISPIFWCNWWDDVFARNVRLQEIGIYPTNPMAVDSEDTILEMNSQFYIPFETISLPDGNTAMVKSEKKFLDYHNKRIKEKEEEVRKENLAFQNSNSYETGDNPLSPGSSKSSEPDVLMTKTRKRLESIYLKDAGFEDSTALTDWLDDESQIDDDKDNNEDINGLIGTKESTRSKDNDYIEDWMRQRIEQASMKDQEVSNASQSMKATNPVDNTENPSAIDPDQIKEETDPSATRMEEKIKNSINSLESVKKSQVVEKEPRFSIDDNPVFKAYREGTLTDKKSGAKAVVKKMGPYPGNEHFVGIWKVVVNPMGDLENTKTEGGSENLLLRVDGTTAAGPTLNPETNQKAAGGTWKFFEQEDGDVMLRIRLVIPPEKKRILVMEGRVSRGMQIGVNMASRTFGIPQVEERAKQGIQVKDDDMTCSGEAYIEDAVTKKNRIRAENFYIEKVQGGKDPDNYTVTIPKTIRRLD